MCSVSLVTILSKDYNMDSYILKCPVLNQEAQKKPEHTGQEAPEPHDEYQKKAEWILVWQDSLCKVESAPPS